jgi:exodeoxyribonuclease V beta subunit
MQALDVFGCPLDGVTQIEASAGTGKTWNICALYVRLLLEKALDADQILVVTFTKAATAELHERIRSRLAGLIHVLREAGVGDDGDGGDGAHALFGARPFAGGDPFVTAFLHSIVGARVTPREALLRLQRALDRFDQAAIHTIHAFCQRALAEAPFAAGMPFAFELTTDDAAQRMDVATAFWRTRVEPAAAADPGFAAWLVQLRVGPEALDEQLARRLKKPLARLVFGAATREGDEHGNGDGQDAPGGHAAGDSEAGNGAPERTVAPATPAASHAASLRTLFGDAAALWCDARDALRDLMTRSLPALNAQSYKPATVEMAFAEWDRYFEAGDALVPPAGKAELLAASTLGRRVKKAAAAPEHPFFALADTLLDAARSAGEAHARAWLGLLRDWLAWAPGALASAKRRERVVSFDDLLSNLHGALGAHPWLARALAERYPAALIDEFQDTDPIQFDIFRRIYTNGPTRGPLFLVGDPKQAIYSFRAADLHTYLRARDHADAGYTLAVNQRSVGAMIAACNALFSANPCAFILPGLDYVPVRPGTRARPPFLDGAGDAAPAGAAMRVWWLPQDAILGKREAQQAAAEASAAEIVRLLRGAREGKVRVGEAALAPGDIAVLVQTHRQGTLVKRVLAAWGVSSVELAQDSVFATADAGHFQRVLLAIDAPGDPARLRAALSVDWLGLDATAVWRLAQAQAATPLDGDSASDLALPDGAHSPAGWLDDALDADATLWVERFSRYRLLWLEHGFAHMWRTFMRETALAARLIDDEDGERRLTDLNHLAELLQARAQSRPGITPTLRWLDDARRARRGGDDAQLRLESDRNLVQIVTVHKAKGLEYAIVFCPFLGDAGQRAGPGGRLPEAREYHDADGTAVIHYGCDARTEEAVRRSARVEQSAERARLIYVALTRAVYRCYIAAGVYASGGHASTSEAQASVLNWLVAGADATYEGWLKSSAAPAALRQAWERLAGDALCIAPLPVPAARVPLAPAGAAGMTCGARTARRRLRETWSMTSYSALVAGLGSVRLVQEVRPDHDALPEALSGGAASAAAAVAPAHAHPGDILSFPRGASAGECLHRFLELADFGQPQSWPVAAARALRERPVPVPQAWRVALAGEHDPHGGERLADMLVSMMNGLCRVELAPGVRLDRIAAHRRLNEMEFTLPVTSLDIAAVARLLGAHGYPEMPFDARTLSGYLKGFIDLIFEDGQRYWIVDWKSNHLGDTAAHYARAALAQAMAGHAYHLQALLYTVALHRFLRHRLPGYDYDVHFGGTLYLFLRGVKPGWRDGDAPAGVYADRPARALVEALDRMFG